ncbi:MAG: hypothetical protein P8P30_03115 [Rickettsiales bacterium]|nr:hypothetical protein [Rickettsiales bacterium]
MTIRVPTNGKPSKPENRMWAWGLLGFVLIPFSTPLLGISVGFVVGSIIGELTGKQKQKREIETGFKEIRKPSLINGGLAKNFLIGTAIMTVAMVATAGLAVLATGGTMAAAVSVGAHLLNGAAISSVVTPALYGTATAAAGLVGLAGLVPMVVASWKGATNRRNEMAQDYEEGKMPWLNNKCLSHVSNLKEKACLRA